MTGLRVDVTPRTAARSVWLVRHAATDWTGRRWCGRSDPDLNVAGRRQAARVAAELAADLELVAPGEPALVLTSPLRRATQTAAGIARVTGASIVVDDSLVEVDFGLAEGLTWDAVRVGQPALAEALVAGADPDWPGGETAAELVARASRAADRISSLAAVGPVVVVSHGGLLRSIAVLAGSPAAGGLGAATFECVAWPASG